MPLRLNTGKCTLLGNYRENNEDAIESKQFPDMSVCIVADGMGGQAAGEIASKRAIEVVPRELRRHLKPGLSKDEAIDIVRKSVVQANEEIISMGSLDPDLKNMGTTIVMCVWQKTEELYIASVGDSRAYLVREGEIEQLTTDHSLAQALVENNTISAEDAREHRFRNVLWKYLGSREVGQGPDVIPITIQAGDRFLLCTDGLTGVVDDEQLLNFMQEHTDVQLCADGLGELALNNGSRDNVSCIVVDVADQDPK